MCVLPQSISLSIGYANRRAAWRPDRGGAYFAEGTVMAVLLSESVRLAIPAGEKGLVLYHAHYSIIADMQPQGEWRTG